MTTSTTLISTGITALDDRIGGFQPSGTYLVVGAPGPAKMVASLQFLHAGVTNGESALLLTNADAASVLEVSRAWGIPLDAAWQDGLLQIVGFRDDFELRAIRSIAPEEVLEELGELVIGTPARIAVDPGSMFLTGGAKTLLGSAFLSWADDHPATVLATFSVDGDAASLPSTADWLLNATTGLLSLERRPDGLYQVSFSQSVPGSDERGGGVSLELQPGHGLVKPKSYPSRRGADRAGVDRKRLLLVSLGASHASDLETWTKRSFATDVVTEPFEAVEAAQRTPNHGCVLVYATRRQVREAVKACRAIRPLTRAAIVFASDEAIRSTDRIHILEAGADDCLSGGLDFRELGLRIEQSMDAARTSRDGSSSVQAAPDLLGGSVTLEVLQRELARRAADPGLAFFCVLDVLSKTVPPARLEEELEELVRSEEGDLVFRSKDRCYVLLQGAREAMTGAFVDRLRSGIENGAGADAAKDLTIEVLSHPGDSDDIAARLGTAGADGD